jgi:hypothetical protein
LPIVPDCAQPSPQESIRRGQFGRLTERCRTPS